MALRLTVPDADLAALGALLRAAEARVGTAAPLLRRLGVQVLAEIARNFQVGGRPPWKPLAPTTALARRGGTGGQPLVNTGRLRDSWDLRVEARRAVVFSRSPIAAYHEFGTRPYEIRPKRPGGVLAIPAGPYTKAGLGRSVPIRGRASYRFTPAPGQRIPRRLAGRVGKPVLPYTAVRFVRHVHHPGLPARPMLPTVAQIAPVLRQIALDYLTSVGGGP